MGFAADLLAGLRGELSPTESEQVRRHVAECDACRDEEAGIDRLSALMARVPVLTPDPGALAKVRERIRQPNPRARAVRLAFPAAALAAASLLLLATLLTSSSEDPRNSAFEGPPDSASCPARTAHGTVLLEGTGLLEDTGLATALRPVRGRTLSAKTLSRIELELVRTVDLTLAEGSRIVCTDDRTVRILSGRLLARVGSGEEAISFTFADGVVVVTGTVFDLNLHEDRSVLTVLEGEVVLRAGVEPVRLSSCMSVTIPRGGLPQAPAAADPWRARDWCSAPSSLLTASPERLTLTLANEKAAPLSLKIFDPASAYYFLKIEGDSGPLPPRRIQAAMVREGAREARADSILGLRPGESYRLVLDPAKLGLSPGTYRVSAVYKPYGDLPENVWQGDLVSPPATLHID